ncbi:MAG: PilZ domain-containing protein, partial [Planctomycetota bacterium]
AEAHFEAGGEPSLPLGCNIEVEFSGAPLSKPRVVSARVRSRSADHAGSYVTFELGEEARALLLPGVSRRDAVRIRPSATQPVRVTLAGPKKLRVDTLCRDLSTVGLAVLLTKESERLLCELDVVTAEIALPGRGDPIQLEARICQRKLAGPKRLYGLEFTEAPSNPKGRSPEQDRIHEFVMERQRAMLQAARQEHPRRAAS